MCRSIRTWISPQRHFTQVQLMTGEVFFNRLAKVLAENPPYSADSRMVEVLKKRGVEAGQPFYTTKLDPAVLNGINQVPAEVNKLFEIGPYGMKTVNGWIN